MGNELKTNTKKRVAYLDMTKGLGIFMITYGHITALGNPVDEWMSLFKVSIFYVVAGYMIAMSGKKDKTTWGAYSLHVLKGLGIPYITLGLAAAIVRPMTMFLKGRDWMYELKLRLFEIISLHGVSALWFLPTLFVGQVVYFAILRIKKKEVRFAVMGFTWIWPIVLGLLTQKQMGIFKGDLAAGTLSNRNFMLVTYPFLAIAKGLVAVWFLQAGYLGYEALRLAMAKLQGVKPEEIPASLLADQGSKLSYLKFALGLGLSLFTIWFTKYNPHIDFNGMTIGEGLSSYAFFLGGITGSYGALLVFEFLEHYFKLELFTYFGKNSLILMGTQRGLMIINLAVAGWKSVVKLESGVCGRYYLECLAILSLVLLMTYGIIEFIQGKAPWIIGKKKK